jgi:hypothetical protein
VLAFGPEARVDFYRQILEAFVVGRRAAGDRWRTMPFAPYGPVVQQIEDETRKLEERLRAEGRVADADLGGDLHAAIACVRTAQMPYLATILLGSAFTCYAELANDATVPAYARATIRERRRDLVGARLRAVRFLMDDRSPLLRGPTGEERRIVDELAVQVEAARDILGELDLGDKRLDGLDWKKLLDGLRYTHAEGLVTLMRPAIEAFLEAAGETTRDPDTGQMHVPVDAWRRADEARARFVTQSPLNFRHDDSFENGRGLFAMMKLAGAGGMVPFPTFAEIGEAEIGLEFTSRIAPLGIVLRDALVDEFTIHPHEFYEHDNAHGLIAQGLLSTEYARSEPATIGPVARFLEDDQDLLSALPSFMRRIEGDDGAEEEFYDRAHEKARDPRSGPESRARAILLEEIEKVRLARAVERDVGLSGVLEERVADTSPERAVE